LLYHPTVLTISELPLSDAFRVVPD
jgi:hypothetical protein